MSLVLSVKRVFDLPHFFPTYIMLVKRSEPSLQLFHVTSKEDFSFVDALSRKNKFTLKLYKYTSSHAQINLRKDDNLDVNIP